MQTLALPATVHGSVWLYTSNMLKLHQSPWLLLIPVTGLLACAPQARFPGIFGGAGAGGGSQLLQSSNFTLVGGMRVPVGADDRHSAHLGGKALFFDPNGNSGAGSLLISGCECPGGLAPLMAEISIPTLVNSATLTSLNTGGTLVAWTDPSGGNWTSISGGNNFIGGIYDCKSALCGSEQVLVSYYEYYGTNQQYTTFTTSRSSFTELAGPYRIGPVASAPNYANVIGGTGWTSGEIVDIPSTYQAALGGKALAGICCLAVVGRTSQGPTATAFDPSAIATNPVGNLDVGYDQNNTTLGAWGSAGLQWSGSAQFWGLAFPTNARSILFSGTYAGRAACIPNGAYPSPANGCNPNTGFCYGPTTPTSALDNTASGDPAHDYCYDPTQPNNSGPGPVGYPYSNEVMFFKETDLESVKAGSQSYFNPTPYATWTPSLPIGGCTANSGPDPCLGPMAWAASGTISGSTCPCLFLSELNVDSNGPVIWMFTVSTPSAPEPKPLTALLGLASLGVTRWTK